MRFSEEKITASRNFCNKIWNAARFILMNLGENPPPPACPSSFTPKTSGCLASITAWAEVTDNLDKFELRTPASSTTLPGMCSATGISSWPKPA